MHRRAIALSLLLMLAIFDARAAPFSMELTQQNELQLESFGSPAVNQVGSSKLEFDSMGVEKSQCDQDYGRKSLASGTAETDVLDRRDDSISFSMIAQSTSYGGHYRTCAKCAANLCLVIHGNDTVANAKASTTAILAISFSDDSAMMPFLLDLGVASGNKSPSIEVTEAGRPELLRSDADGSFLLRPKPGSIYYLRANVDAITSNKGFCCSDSKTSSARVDVRLRKAPILWAQGGFQPYIVGGAETAKGAYAYVGALLVDGKLNCTGTVVGTRTILTAAHCLQGFEEQVDKMIFLSGPNISQPLFGPYEIESMLYPRGEIPGFRFNPKTLEDDIGVVYLKMPTKISPATLHRGVPTWEQINARQSNLEFVGYGYDIVDNQMVGLGTRRAASWSINSVENRRISFSVPHKNTCKGDSGGPAFLVADQHITQVAVTSGGSEDCTTGFETRVDSFAPWLADKIK